MALKVRCIGGPLLGLYVHSSATEFVYTDPRNSKKIKYLLKTLHGQPFFVAEFLDLNFAEKQALFLLR